MFEIQRPPVQVLACSWNPKPRNQILVFFQAWFWQNKFWLLTTFLFVVTVFSGSVVQLKSLVSNSSCARFLLQLGMDQLAWLFCQEKNWEVTSCSPRPSIYRKTPRPLHHMFFTCFYQKQMQQRAWQICRWQQFSDLTRQRSEGSRHSEPFQSAKESSLLT